MPRPVRSATVSSSSAVRPASRPDATADPGRGAAMTVAAPTDTLHAAGPTTRVWLFAGPVCVVVLVVTAKPVERVVGAARLVSPSRPPVEPLVDAPEAIQTARVGRVRVVDDSVFERERAHARALPRIGRPVGARRCGPRVERPTHVLRRRPHGRLAEVVLEGARTLLLLGEGDVEVVVEAAPE